VSVITVSRPSPLRVLPAPWSANPAERPAKTYHWQHHPPATG
jgi:hypothetical protein